MKLTFAWDDGALEDQRLYELHERYKIPGIFYVPTENREGRAVVTSEMMRGAESPYVSFGGHTQHHTYLTDIPFEQVDGEIRENQVYLEDALGHPVEHFCLPGGHYNGQILETAHRYYRTVRAAENMHFHAESNGLIYPTFHYYPIPVKESMWHALLAGSWGHLPYMATHHHLSPYDLIQSMINHEAGKDSSIIVWGHSWEIEELGVWDQLERLMQSDVVQACKCTYDEIL